MDTAGVEAIHHLKSSPPKNVGDFRLLMGLLNCYRRYIPIFSRRAKPIYDLVKRDGLEIGIEVGDHQLILKGLLEHLVDPPVMAYPDFTKSFIVCTDTFKEGLGGVVLYQRQSGETRVIAFLKR